MEKALNLFENALEFATKANNHFYEAVWLECIGVTHYQIGDFEKAIDYYRKALQASTPIESGNNSVTGDALGNLGLTYLVLGQHLEAIRLLREAYEC